MSWCATLAAVASLAVAEPASAGTLEVEVSHTFRGKLLPLGEVSLLNRSGNVFSVTRVSYLVSGFTLYRADGRAVPIGEQRAYLDVAKDRTTFRAGEVPAGDYKAVSFRIGVPAELNHADPSSFPAGDALNPLLNGLHWSWQGGYVFLALEGRYQMPDGSLGGYVYHLANDPNLTTVSLPAAFRIAPGEHRKLVLEFDLSRLFDGSTPIRISQTAGTDSTHSATGDALAASLHRNLSRSFLFHGLGDASPKPSPTQSPVAPPSGTTAYALTLPPSFPPAALPADNPLTNEGIALGKRLFADPRLSGNGRQSCASCHREESAFSDGGRATSVGIDGIAGTRNAPSLQNLLWSPTYAWDGRRARLRDQALAAMVAPHEMHADLKEVCRVLDADGAMTMDFSRAFGSPGVTPERIGLAIEQYVLTLVSADSKYDRAKRREATFTDQEKQGFMLFITEYDPARRRYGADCFHCHGGNDLFTDFQFKNTGLDRMTADLGRESVTDSMLDRAKFKTPSLRNVAVTGPYMHDGRFQTLEEVIDHYCDGVEDSATLDPNLAKHPQRKLPLSQSDRDALVAFLKTLTDPRYATKTP